MAGINTEALTLRVTAAHTLLAAHDYQGAITALEAVVADAPQFELAVRSLSDLYNIVGRRVDAVRVLESAMEVEIEDAIIINALYYRTQITQSILNGLDPNKPDSSPANT